MFCLHADIYLTYNIGCLGLCRVLICAFQYPSLFKLVVDTKLFVLRFNVVPIASLIIIIKY